MCNLVSAKKQQEEDGGEERTRGGREKREVKLNVWEVDRFIGQLQVPKDYCGTRGLLPI